MSYLVSALPDDELLLNCTDTVTSVLQNIKCIIQTRKGDICYRGACWSRFRRSAHSR